MQEIEEHLRLHHAIVANDEAASRTNIHRLIHDIVECWRSHAA